MLGNKKEEKKIAKAQAKVQAREAQAQVIYAEMRRHLKPKDGKIHVAMVNSFSKFANQVFGFEDKYTNQIDGLLSFMQDDGYEIVDVKFSVIEDQGITGNMEGFNTLILYR